MTDLKWTKDAPTKAGWYWLRESGGTPWVCRVERSPDGGFVMWELDEAYPVGSCLIKSPEWAGPIEPPS